MVSSFVNLSIYVPRPLKPPKKSERYELKDFEYAKSRDRYICPAGKELRLEKRAGRIKNLSGRHYKARQADCSVCKLRDRCLKTSETRCRYLFIVERRYERNYSEEMKRKVDTERGRDIYSRRMGIVEPVFANIRCAKQLDRFTLRGRIKVTIQWMLYAMVHNIEKICKFGAMDGAVPGAVRDGPFDGGYGPPIPAMSYG